MDRSERKEIRMQVRRSDVQIGSGNGETCFPRRGIKSEQGIVLPGVGTINRSRVTSTQTAVLLRPSLALRMKKPVHQQRFRADDGVHAY